ncbi:MAG TPA: S8 family serine peptidase [Ilumatobacteraceae bacterium]|nr:S8 family serine peptidase [Ilumatobacteraceae bacterium]
MNAKRSVSSSRATGAAPRKKRAAAKQSAKKAPKPAAGGLPPLIYAQASPRSIGGVSMFDMSSPINADNVVAFTSEDEVTTSAVIQLQAAGFEVLQVSPTSINIAGRASLYEQAFGCTLYTENREVIKGGARQDEAQFVDVRESNIAGLVPTAGSAFADVLEGVAIEEPVYFMAPNALAPLKSYHHLRVPGDVSLALNADRAHRGGITGKNVKVVMVDSGWEAHPYFVQRGYKFSPTVLGPSAVNAGVDENGHGTAESANIFAAAPDVHFTMVKINFVNSTGSFNTAVGLAPQIISCSWGSSVQNPPLSAANQALAASIAAAVASGIIVVFSAGNGHFGFPGQHPDVISAGGTFMSLNGSTQASNYSSGFMSNVYPGRRVPDLTGLVGQKPRAAYIMLPLPQGCAIDVSLASGGAHPNSDETTGNDGWAAISGTSAAAPQLAGVSALIKQACPRLTPAEVRDILKSTARDVTAGSCNTSTGGHAATVGPDLATGHGLVDAHKAVLVAKVRCLGPIRPPIGVTPIGVTPVVRPPIGVTPVVRPPIGVTPVVRPPIGVSPVIQPIQPPVLNPIQPPRPVLPVINPGGAISGMDVAQDAGEASGPGLTAEDVAALEELIRDGGDDLSL